MQVKKEHLLSSSEANNQIIFAEVYAITRVSEGSLDIFDYTQRQL